MKVIVYIFCLFFVIATSCAQKKDGQSERRRSVSKECIALNDDGVEKLNSYYNSKGDTVQLDSALLLLEKAVQCDNDYFVANANIATVLTLKGRYDAAIVVVEKLLKLTNNDPDIVVYKGMLYEKTGNIDDATAHYIFAEALYKDRLAEDPESSPLIAGKVYLKAYLEGKDKALQELDQYIEKYPDNVVLQQHREALNHFTKEEFLKGIGPMHQ